MSTTSKAEAVKRSDDVWFEEGDLIVEAEGTWHRICSRVLAQHSSVFRDMLSLQLPPDAESFQGLPVIHLTDPAQELTYLFKALHDSSFLERSLPTQFAIVSGVLTLSTKYDVDYLRERAISHLMTNYPNTLDGWDRRDSLKTIQDIPYLDFAALSLANATGVPQALPAIMYSICSHPVPEIMEGFQAHPCPDLERSCLEAIRPLLKVSNQPTFFMLALKDQCCRLDRHFFKNPDQEESLVGTNILELCTEVLDVALKDACHHCALRIPHKLEGFKSEFWNRLPDIFKLPSGETTEEDSDSDSEDEA